MIVYGFAKQYRYTGSGTLEIQVRIPNIHGPMTQEQYNGQAVRNYTRDQDLPWYPSLLLPHLPTSNEVVALTSMNESSADWLIIGLTGGQYAPAAIS